MDSTQWISRCTARLQQRWPRIPPEQLAEIARDLKRELDRQAEHPEQAAMAWLRQGLPDA